MSRLLARNRALFRRSNLSAPKLAQFTASAHLKEIPLSPNESIPEADTQQHIAAGRERAAVESKESTTHSEFDFNNPKNASDILDLLSTPTWSVRSLLPSEEPTEAITQSQLSHLLRLSALPPPSTDAETVNEMLKTFHSQLHFVKDIQSVDTEGVDPLVRIAEETEVGRREATIGLQDLKDALDKEVVIGRNKRRRRVRDEGTVEKGEDWDVFKTATETVEVPGAGRYFVVRSGKAKI